MAQYSASDLVQLSALQHYLFCPRQCALIHIEQIWTENVLTAEGRVLHQKADSGQAEKRVTIKSATGLYLQSLRLGLAGRADVVEFHAHGSRWRPLPVEYKRGRPKKGYEDRAQICAQALCLEEMLNVEIPEGALYYGQTRHRLAVKFDAKLRSLTENTALELHEFIDKGMSPSPVDDRRCKSCSLKEICLPSSLKVSTASRYLENLRATV